ncbi:MAG: lytic murein transglycosylase, partial [Cocleimonas sp.]|nr:lytic murein transglycosylase [Cocleimonas sp.]
MVTNRVLNVSSGILFLALLGGCSTNNIQPTEMSQLPVNVPAVVNTTVIKKKIVQKPVVHRPRPQVATLAQQVAKQRLAKQKAAQQLAARKRQLAQKKRNMAKRHLVRKVVPKQVVQRRHVVKKAAPRRYTPRYQAVKKVPQRRYTPRYQVVKKAPQRRYVPRQKVARKAPPRRYVRPVPQRVYVAPKTAMRQYAPRPRVQRPQQRPQQLPQLRKASLTGDFAGNTQAHRFIDKMVSRHGFDRRYLNGVLSNAQATNWMRKMAAKDERPLKRKSRKNRKKNRSPSWTRYRSHFITSRHINAGVAFYNKHRATLERAERQFGVPKEYILGILGVETIFGGNVGKNRAIDALTTMAFNNKRRGRYFESELESYLLMTRSARLNPLTPKASYAGALGLSQFMPSNIKKYGVDFDGDGGVNLWKPDDAIASIAKYFKRHGWRTGEMVAVPARSRGKRYRSLKVGFKHKHSPARLSRKGITAKYSHNMKGSLRFIKLNAR